jgi:hypothetical protein
VNHPWGEPRSGKSDRYFEPSSELIGGPNFTAVKSNRALRDGQTQPNAPGLSFPRLVEPEKRAKQLLQRGVRYPRLMVANLDDGFGVGIACFAEEANFDLCLVGGVPHRVADDIFHSTVEQFRAAYRAALVRLVLLAPSGKFASPREVRLNCCK